MSQTLYLMLGYPGAGKTTTAQVLHEITSAEHVWADDERRKLFQQPTYTHQENIELYEILNKKVENILQAGKSVIYDTSFSFYSDREKLRNIAIKHGAKTLIIWVQAPKELARSRATDRAHEQETRVLGNMRHETFDRMSSNIEEPKGSEQVVVVDGTKVTLGYIKSLLEL